MARVSLPYPLVCTVLGLVLGWVPMFLHGPIPEKFDVLYMRGAIAVWAFYSARLLIGPLVGITSTPRLWYVRGPMCGFLMLLPVGLVALANPGCRSACMFWNEVTGTAIGMAVAGLAYAITGRHHAYDTATPRTGSP